MSHALAAFRSRRWLFAVLAVLVVANVVVLLSYRALYDARLRSLQEARRGLEQRLVEARRSAEKARGAEAELTEVQDRLTRFFDESLGLRRERLAGVIEELYATTRKLGMRPDSIGYTSTEDAGSDRLSFAFGVSGRYGDLKKLLAALESSPRFLVLEQVALASDPVSPDSLNVSLTLTHYFRPTTTRVVRRAKAPAPGKPAAPPQRRSR